VNTQRSKPTRTVSCKIQNGDRRDACPTKDLLRLCEEHIQSRPAWGRDLVLFFLRTMRNGVAVAVLVRGRLAIHQQHIMMRFVAFDVMNGRMPGVHLAIAQQRHALPMGERTYDFNRSRFLGLPVRQSPAEDLGISLFTRGAMRGSRCTRTGFAKSWGIFVRRGPAKQITDCVEHIVFRTSKIK